jgi:8-oxo-dGTP pyrophosphatase MutT (NUDIX family)
MEKTSIIDDTETVDIVDEHDNILYQTTKQEAHSKGLMHRTVIANILDENNKLVLVKQASDRQDAGQYVSPVGGHARTGETEEDALKREALEETGITNFRFKLKGKFVFSRFILNRHENHLFVVYEIYNSHNIKLNSESVSYRSYTIDELKEGISINRKEFGEAFLKVLENIYPEILKNKAES